METNPQVSIIVPLYNEEDSYPLLIERLNELIANINISIEVVLIDDGSVDNTPALMMQTGLMDAHYTCLFLSRNFGHQIAITAGLKNATCAEGAMIIDGDLQDSPELLDTFYNLYKNDGFDIVYGVRKNRKENIVKRICYALFYRILKKFSSIYIPLDSGDFGFLSRNVIDIINQMPEESRFLRGMRAWVGFKQTGVEYERARRNKGSSKYSFTSLIKLAFNGIFNFSEFPVKFIGRLGFLAITISTLYFIYTVYAKLIYKNVPSGFTALIFIIILFSGIQLISVSILGQYIIRIFYQVKNRPLYILKNKIFDKQFTK